MKLHFMELTSKIMLSQLALPQVITRDVKVHQWYIVQMSIAVTFPTSSTNSVIWESWRHYGQTDVYDVSDSVDNIFSKIEEKSVYFACKGNLFQIWQHFNIKTTCLLGPFFHEEVQDWGWYSKINTCSIYCTCLYILDRLLQCQ